MHSHSLFSHKRTVSICCACILLVALVCCVLPFLSQPAAAAAVADENGVVTLSDCLVSSQQDSDSLDKVYRITDNDPGGSSNLAFSFVDGYKFTSWSSHSKSLSECPGVFYVGDILTGALSFKASYNFSFVTSGSSTFRPSLDFYISFLDGDGAFISYKSLAYYAGSKYPNTRTFTGSVDFEVPANAVYFRFFVYYGSVSGFSSVTSSCAIDITASYTPLVPPPTPTVTSHFSPSYSYNVGATADRLEATISPVSDGELSAQWYVNTVNSTTGGTPISGAESNFYVPVLDFLGTRYYYLEVTNTLNGLTVTVYSNVCAITVSVVPPKLPTVTSHFAQSYTYKIGDAAAELVVSATVADDGVLSYQWYVFEYTGSSADNYEPIPGATSANYRPVLDFVGTRYYMCAVTNTLSDLTVSVDSNSVMITVKPMSYTLLAGQYEMNVASDGLYYPLFPWPEDLRSVDLLFRSSGIPYSQMSYKFDIINEAGYYLYYDSDKAYLYAEAIEDEGFLSDAFALIFIEADQTVPTEFYEWFVGNFTYIGPDEEIPIYYTTINIMDNAGNNLLDGITFPGNGMSPVLYGYVVADGLTVLTSAGLEWPWAVGSDVEEFLGFSIEPGATAAWYIPNETFTIGGTASDSVLTLYLVVPAGTSVDDDYAASSLKWYERIFYDIGKGFTNLGMKIETGLNDIKAALAPSEGAKLLGIIDFASIGEFFRTAYEGLGDLFGIGSFITGDDSPFSWLVG